MASENELDLVTRALNGEHRARTTIYRDFFRDNNYVRRAGSAYLDPMDFLHDCFTNFLHTGQAWDRDGSLSSWVESIANWTAVQYDRMQSITSFQGIRMCAEMEGEAGERRVPKAGYNPPEFEPGDTPAKRIFSYLDETQARVVEGRCVADTSWEAIAAATGKPIHLLGAVFARALSRSVRLFAAPAPLDDDLEVVFRRSAENKDEPDGRAISMQLDSAFYTPTPELRLLGVGSAQDARMHILWNAAASAPPPDVPLRAHLDSCHYCSSLLRSLLLLRSALRAAPDSEFLLCPGGFSLANTTDESRADLEQHLAKCRLCLQERTGKTTAEGTAGALRRAGDVQGSPGRKVAWAAAALVILGTGSFFGYRYFQQRQDVMVAKQIEREPTGPTVAIDPRYIDLVQNVSIDDKKVMNAALAANRDRLRIALDSFTLGNVPETVMITSQIVDSNPDPSAGTLYAMALYRSNLMSDGYRQMLRAEAMPPQSPYRCWIMMQFALMVGERKVVEREAGHLDNDPEYGAKAKDILARFEARK